MERNKKVVRDPFSRKKDTGESTRPESVVTTVKSPPPWKMESEEPIQHTTVTLSPEEHRFLNWVRKQIIKQRSPKGKPKITKSAVVRAVLLAFMDVAPMMNFNDVRDERDLKDRFVRAVRNMT